jgi:nucleoside-diphosphate-sugar epimerase
VAALKAQLAHDPDVAEVVVLNRPRTITDRKTSKVAKVLSPADRGRDLLDQLWLDAPETRRKFRFVAGDVERPCLGISPGERRHLQATITHVIHSAASVAFDDPYEESFRANVTGTLNVLHFSPWLQRAADSPTFIPRASRSGHAPSPVQRLVRHGEQ